MAEEGLKLWAQSGRDRVRTKLYDIDTRAWLSETLLLMDLNQKARLVEEEDDDIETVVSELESLLAKAQTAGGNALKAYINVHKIASEGSFTESLQKDALTAEGKLDSAIEALNEKCDWYRKEIVKRLKEQKSGK